MGDLRFTREEIIARRGYRKNILGDKFSLYISNYPVNANYLKSRIGNSELVLAELCCSIGITLEYLAPVFKKVIGLDIDKQVLESCKKNLMNAGLIDKAEFIEGDVFKDAILKNIDADVVIYDIPFWYEHQQENKGNLIDKNPPLEKLIQKIRKYITRDIMICSPPEWKYKSMIEELGEMEFEKVYVDGRHDRNQIYLGNLIHQSGITQIELDSK